MNFGYRIGAALLWLAVLSVPAAAQNIDRVRELYVAAAYEEALAAMPIVAGEPARVDLEQYRALCLLALGREQEAVAAVERLVRANPTFLPSASDTSPRMQTIFTGARAKVLPALAKQAYLDAKGAYEAKDRGVAKAGFQRTLDLIDSLPDDPKSGLADLRLLAAEFLELSAVAPDRPAGTPAGANQPVGASSDASLPAVAQLDSPGPPAGDYVAPVAVREEMPRWIPPDRAAMRTEYVGSLRVVIGADGRVQSASIIKTSHPAYDAAVVRAATRWTYKPAMRGGQPVVAHKDIQVRLVPR